MFKPLMIGLLTLTGVGTSFAFHQFDIRIEDMSVVACWDAASCTATEGYVHIFNVNNPDETHTIPCVISTGGSPLAYRFVADYDAQLNDCLDGEEYEIDERWAHFEGPGFDYEVIRTNGLVYECGIPFPSRIIPPAGDGCQELELGDDWTWEVYPEGRVDITEDYTIPQFHTVTIDPGIEVFALPGVVLSVAGRIESNGTAENPVVFTGNNWDGIEFLAGSTNNNLRYTHFINASSEDNGGALGVAAGSIVRLYDCLIAHNSSTAEGGAAYLADGGVLSVNACTISDNTGATVGGVFVDGENSIFESTMSILSFATPVNSELVGTGFANVSFTNIFPQSEGFPEGMEPQAWYCDPGYVDAAGLDYNISYWSVDDPSVANCIIDVSVNPDEMDPDGTAGDIGAFPYDQHNVMLPATILTVSDRANDQGGYVLVEFLASPNDGSWLNPTTMYSIWIQYPGMGEDEWVSAGTVAALADPEMHYFVQVPTLNDQFEGNENVHGFMVGTHSVHFPTPVASDVMTGFSLDNIAPTAVASANTGDWEYDQWEPTQDLLPLSWSPSISNDVSYYEVVASLSEDIGTAEPLYTGSATSAVYASPFGELELGDHVYYWVTTVDNHLNRSTPVMGGADYVGIAERLPSSYELSQNFPNPFNPTTTIDFALPQAGQVKLTVYNMMGSTVATLVNGQKAAGRYSLQFDGSKLASGVYFYKLETPSFSDLKKMILVK